MILITGSTGFVGMHLLKELSESKTQIVAMYRSEKKKKLVECFFDNTNSKIDNIIWRKSNINDVISLDEVFKGITQVYHCARGKRLYLASPMKLYMNLYQIYHLGSCNWYSQFKFN